jgi:hypothetical protein
MNRRDAMQGIATALLAPCWPVGRELAAGLGFARGVVPTIAVVGAADDPRQALGLRLRQRIQRCGFSEQEDSVSAYFSITSDRR